MKWNLEKTLDLPISSNHPNYIKQRQIKLDYVGLLTPPRVLLSERDLFLPLFPQM